MTYNNSNDNKPLDEKSKIDWPAMSRELQSRERLETRAQDFRSISATQLSAG